VINTLTDGKTVYTFTPEAGQCADKAALEITIEIVAVLGSEETIMGACNKLPLDASMSVGDIIKYEWSLPGQGGALTQLTGMNTEFYLSPAYTGPLPADFKVRLLVTDRTGNTTSDTISITVDRPPVASISSSGKLESDGSMKVDGLASSGTTISHKWSSTEGKIVGPDNLPAARFLGAGNYMLTITDKYGCTDQKPYVVASNLYDIIANPDYARISWAQDTTMNVLGNDRSTVNFVPGSVQIIKQPARGTVKVNANGTITYIPGEKQPGQDQFTYAVSDEANLNASAAVTIDIYNPKLTIPEGLSPNGDGVNDILDFKGLENYQPSQIYVYTRSGQLVYQSGDYANNWDGTALKNAFTGEQHVPTGTYYYVLKLGVTNRVIKGFIYIGY
jgi:gliding motility-associated-like protein